MVPYRADNYNDVGDMEKYYIREGCVVAQRYYYYSGTIKLRTWNKNGEQWHRVQFGTRPYWRVLINYCINCICGCRDVLSVSILLSSMLFRVFKTNSAVSLDCEAVSSAKVT